MLRIGAWILVLGLASVPSLWAGDSREVRPYVSGEDVNVPNATHGERRKWTPANTENTPGFAGGGPFEATLIKVFNEDSQFSKEIAVFRMSSGAVRAFQTDSFIRTDVDAIHAFKATPVRWVEPIKEPEMSYPFELLVVGAGQ